MGRSREEQVKLLARGFRTTHRYHAKRYSSVRREHGQVIIVRRCKRIPPLFEFLGEPSLYAFLDELGYSLHLFIPVFHLEEILVAPVGNIITVSRNVHF